MAQDSYYSPYGYADGHGYETNNSSRQFNFNPADMVNQMSNPMRSMFGSSRRGYDDHTVAGYPPAAYPPVYGYPAYPAYQQPYRGYSQIPQPPIEPDYTIPYSYIPAQPALAEPARQPYMQAPPYEREVPPAARDYQPTFANPKQGVRYNFRPLEEELPLADDSSRQPATSASAPSQTGAASTATEPVERKLQPQAPPTYPKKSAQAAPPTPPTYPEQQLQSSSPPDTTPMQQDSKLKFRPLDKPGYSSDLEE
jgi:hypothetical protein